ncbi:MAG TPA: MFS transporter, partial [Actinotalea sp.]|nr:MFS transporter [Actinotalea sp.]
MTATPATTAISSRARGQAGFVTVIGLLALLPAVGTDLYLPSLPDVARELGATEAGAQFTITGVMLGGAVGQLIAGPFSDRFGRRLPAVIGVASHAVLSLLCALAPGIAVLSGLRVLQGFAAAGATVVAIAAIRDRYVGAEAARLMSRLMLVIAAAPLLAPSIGGAIAAAWGWRAVFVALAAVGG